MLACDRVRCIRVRNVRVWELSGPRHPRLGVQPVIVVTTLAFGPVTVHPGGTSTARLSGMNCTRHAQQATLTWLGHYSGSGATGCPVIDPIAEAISVPASSALKAHLAYTVLAGCTAKFLMVTARLSGASGALVADKTARLHIAQKRVAQSG